MAIRLISTPHRLSPASRITRQLCRARAREPVRLAGRLTGMAPAIRRLAGPLLLAVLALVGCASAHSSATPGRAAGFTASQATATAQSPRQRAEVDAAAILVAFVAPSGARKLSGAPAGQASQLKNIAGSSASPNWIDKTGFWQVKAILRECWPGRPATWGVATRPLA